MACVSYSIGQNLFVLVLHAAAKRNQRTTQSFDISIEEKGFLSKQQQNQQTPTTCY